MNFIAPHLGISEVLVSQFVWGDILLLQGYLRLEYKLRVLALIEIFILRNKVFLLRSLRWTVVHFLHSLFSSNHPLLQLVHLI